MDKVSTFFFFSRAKPRGRAGAAGFATVAMNALAMVGKFSSAKRSLFRAMRACLSSSYGVSPSVSAVFSSFGSASFLTPYLHERQELRERHK